MFTKRKKLGIIYGYISLNGKPFEEETIVTMQKALAFSCPDATYLWKDDINFIGTFHKYNTPESIHEKYPMTDGNLIFMAACRIDNRDELNTLLHIPYEQRAIITDGELMFQSYLKWGEGACDRMLGDWQFVAWHKTEQRLILGRDHCGITACYYHILNNCFVFSSSPKAILALGFVPKKINELRIAQLLTAWPGNGEDTCYEGIFNILPGHYLKIEDKKLQKIKYWELTEQDDLILPKEQDYYDRFLEIFTESVRCRLRTTKNVGIMLSGGLDSTSIAAIAAIELAKQNKELFAFTSVPLYKDYKISKNRNGDEGELAGLMAKMYPNIRHFLVNADGYSVIDSIKRGVDIFDEPMHAAANQYWMHAINDESKKNYINVLLNGQAGNGIISWPTSKTMLLNNSYFYNSKYKLYSYLKYLRDYIFDNRSFNFSDINDSFIYNVNLFIDIKLGDNRNFNKQLSFKQTQIKLIRQCIYHSNSLYFRKGIWFGIDNLDSTCSKRLIEFSCSIPQNLYSSNNYDRIFIRNGLKQLLPRSIINSKYKGIQGADVHNRLIYGYEKISRNVDFIKEDIYLKKIIDLEKINRRKDLLTSQDVSSICRDFAISFLIQKINKNSKICQK